jgi:hypothetical protein
MGVLSFVDDPRSLAAPGFRFYGMMFSWVCRRGRRLFPATRQGRIGGRGKHGHFAAKGKRK